MKKGLLTTLLVLTTTLLFGCDAQVMDTDTWAEAIVFEGLEHNSLAEVHKMGEEGLVYIDYVQQQFLVYNYEDETYQKMELTDSDHIISSCNNDFTLCALYDNNDILLFDVNGEISTLNEEELYIADVHFVNSDTVVVSYYQTHSYDILGEVYTAVGEKDKTVIYDTEFKEYDSKQFDSEKDGLYFTDSVFNNKLYMIKNYQFIELATNIESYDVFGDIFIINYTEHQHIGSFTEVSDIDDTTKMYCDHYQVFNDYVVCKSELELKVLSFDAEVYYRVTFDNTGDKAYTYVIDTNYYVQTNDKQINVYNFYGEIVASDNALESNPVIHVTDYGFAQSLSINGVKYIFQDETLTKCEAQIIGLNLEEEKIFFATSNFSDTFVYHDGKFESIDNDLFEFELNEETRIISVRTTVLNDKEFLVYKDQSIFYYKNNKLQTELTQIAKVNNGYLYTDGEEIYTFYHQLYAIKNTLK